MASAADDYAYQLAHINDSRQASAYALNGAMITLSTIAVALRLCSRRLVHAPVLYDDYAIIFALVSIPLTGRVVAESIQVAAWAACTINLIGSPAGPPSAWLD